MRYTSNGRTYTYDANDNMQTANLPAGGSRTFTWDADHRVDNLTAQGGMVDMAYDYTGIRVMKGATFYPFKGYEVASDGTITKYFRIGNEIIAANQGGAKYFYHNDHLGGVNVITDIYGGLEQLNEYDPWGKVSKSEGNADPTRRFTGQELDPETGLYYYGGRYYDQELGRFISADPFVPKPGNPQSLNRYSYVLNNPVILVDPTGHFFGFFIGAIVAAVAAELEVNAIIAGVVAGAAAAAVDTAVFGGDFGSNILLGALSGGIAGAIGPPLFGAFGGGTVGVNGATVAGNIIAAAKAGAVTGAIIGGLGTAFNGGSFGENVGFGALTGGIGAAGAILAGPVVDVLLKDAAATVTGLVGGNVLGAVGGLGDVLAGGITQNWTQVKTGVISLAQALVPRYDTAAGLGWGLPPNPLTALGQAFPTHDEAYRRLGAVFSRLTTPADLQLIRDMWSVLPVGPVGQAYRVGATVAFSLKIFGQDAIGAAAFE